MACLEGQSRRSDLDFRKFVWIWNSIQGLDTPDLHREIADWLDDRWDAGDRRLLLMVFRDAGKSTLAALFCAWLLLKNPNLRIMVLAAEQQLACKMVRNIRRIIEVHKSTQWLMPKKADQWAADQFTVCRDLVQRDPSVLARGITGNITGARADIIICDDVEVPNTSDTPLKRDLLRQRLGELSYVLTPEGTQLFIGTPHNYYTIYADEARPELGEDRAFLDDFEKLKLPVVNAQGRSRWPERFPPSALVDMKRQSGPNKYKSQMLLEPTQITECRLDPDLLRVYDHELKTRYSNGQQLLSLGMEPIVASLCWWDPAFGHSNSGDASVVAVVFQDASGRYYLHDIKYIEVSKLEPEEDEATQSCVQVAKFLERNLQSSVSVETNGLGRFLPSILRREIRRAGLRVVVHEKASSRSKASRIIEAFDAVLAARNLFVHQRVLESGFPREMREWMPARNCRDDGLDAVSACLLALPVRQVYVRGRASPDTAWRQPSPQFYAHCDFVP